MTAGVKSLLNRRYFSIATLSAATLLFESTLIRLLAVAQFYHFAFLVVSLALLGFGASGTVLSVFPHISKIKIDRLLSWIGVSFFISVALVYGVINLLPFDSYSIAWERRQILFFLLYYLALVFPFLISGLGTGAALAASEGRSHLVYAANLLGSGIGVILAPVALELAGVPGAVLISAVLTLVVPLILKDPIQDKGKSITPATLCYSILILVGLVSFGLISAKNMIGQAPLGMTISPYKGLANALRYPGSRTLVGKWNAFSRVDIVADAGVRQLPGLSYIYPGIPPSQFGLSLDAGSLQPITLINPNSFDAADYLPEALIYKLRPGADVLVLEPAGGLGVLQALYGGAEKVTAVIDNPAVLSAIESSVPEWNVYLVPRVSTFVEPPRVFIKHKGQSYEIISVPLTDTYLPVTSGAYSLAEDYALTVDSFVHMLARLSPDGLMVITRWMQTPPSESLRLITTIVEALEFRGVIHPENALVVYRGIQTVTVLVQPLGWSKEELVMVREFTENRKFDLVWTPDIQENQVNRFNKLPDPDLYIALSQLFTFDDRELYYASYPYAITPPTDDKPFFFHFFTWEQTPDVMATFGHTWQPFGGSGYFILLALLILVLGLSLALILSPMLFIRRYRNLIRNTSMKRIMIRALVYYILIGVAFLFIEIPLIQRWILLFGQPTYAFAVVVLALMLFSSLGSGMVQTMRTPKSLVLGLLVILTISTPFMVGFLLEHLLTLGTWLQMGISVICLAPLGFLMGMPFPLGLAWLKQVCPELVPWAWAVNGCASVIASVLAAILSISYGFTAVLILGAGAYLGAALLYVFTFQPQPIEGLRQ